MSVNSAPGNYTRLRRKSPKIVTVSARKERNLSIKKVSVILQKDESKRTKEEKELLFNYSEIVREASLRIEKRKKLKERLKEVEDADAVLDEKCKQLAEAISKAEYLVVYTGAGISTAARIPDYRGASGIWTLLQQGKDIGTHDLTQADPTYTHMALYQLYSQGKLKHIVSQNCDGLHLRSGLPKKALSEVHGNMYIEVCRTCRPIIEYLRLFDVTENTGRYAHRTMRKCYKCNSSLVDSIVHFGERGNLPWPLNWKGACKAAEKADMILCIGSSLKVLKRYPWLWCMDKPAKRRPGIYIVNLQWTPKDCQAIIKINGKCDTVMERLMKYLAITVPKYSRKTDPIFKHATDLCKEEMHTLNRPFLSASVKSELVEVKQEKNWEDEYLADNSTLESAINERNEASVTSCKKEIVIDTGQGPDVKFIKKELIVITIRSGEDFKDCCSLFKTNQTHHHYDCPNFIDEKNDIPVIIEDDLLILKNNNGNSSINLFSPELGVEIKAKLENSSGLDVVKSDNKNGKTEESDLNFAQRFSGEDLMSSSPIKREIQDEEDEEHHYKKLKVKEYKENLSESKEKKEQLKKRSNSSSTNGNDKSRVRTRLDSKETLNCKCCREEYLSNTCLFYLKREPVFKSTESFCDCCSSEDEDPGMDGYVPEEKPVDLQKVTVNPGWYGKGLRKNNRKKR
ncbi:hypothetical protein RUM44_010758 [Polyplax serrata]|uniref:Regulatory protein SIR2 homolog 7 n=1 Tax=Polyplax serrata TaxID=468196 RepID=A0ABR1AN66_POLSC